MTIAIAVRFEFITAWNTHNPYTEHGQRIFVFKVVIDDEVKAYYMWDFDRDVDYALEPLPEDECLPHLVRTWVKHCYDFHDNILYPYQFALGAHDYMDAREAARLFVRENLELAK